LENLKAAKAWQGAENGRPARPQAIWRAERTPVREHDKGPRTPLAAILSILH